jgi:hypothetical protein
VAVNQPLSPSLVEMARKTVSASASMLQAITMLSIEILSKRRAGGDVNSSATTFPPSVVTCDGR